MGCPESIHPTQTDLMLSRSESMQAASLTCSANTAVEKFVVLSFFRFLNMYSCYYPIQRHLHYIHLGHGHSSRVYSRQQVSESHATSSPARESAHQVRVHHWRSRRETLLAPASLLGLGPLQLYPLPPPH